MKITEKPIEQLKVIMKVPIPVGSRVYDKITPILDYTIPQTRSGGDSGSRMVKNIKNISRKIPMYPDPIYRSLLKPAEIPLPEVPRGLLDFDPEINMDFKEN